MSEAAPIHPRDQMDLERIDQQALAFEQALARGRLHHAWLLVGPEGVGKAAFAYRVARRLLGAAPDHRYGPLGASPDDPVARLIAARAHPDLLVLERDVEGGKKSIPVDAARLLPEFFAKAPALGGYRVCIVDAADDLNPNAANAVLKTLEEPPARGVLLMVSHAPGKLLPTIRSRCRRLLFAPWPDGALADLLVRRGGGDPDEAAEVAVMAAGSPGRALAFAATGGGDLDKLAENLLDAAPARRRAQVQTLTDGFRGGEGAARFAFAVELIGAAAHRRALLEPIPEKAAAWAQAWRRCAQVTGEVEGLNLDRVDAFNALVADLVAASSVRG